MFDVVFLVRERTFCKEQTMQPVRGMPRGSANVQAHDQGQLPVQLPIGCSIWHCVLGF